ncbi:MAG: hypothetical protein ACQESF_01130 [Nanobdellota archaeon]
MKEIRRLELAVHLFDDINYRKDYPATKYHSRYTSENESLIKNKYMQRIEDLAEDENSFLIFVAHTRINRGEVHHNVKEIYMDILDKMPGRHKKLELSVDTREIDKLKGYITQDTTFRAWGEYTSGCVLNDFLRLKECLKKDTDYNTIITELKPDLGVDFAHPRPWENYKGLENQINKYQQNVKHNIEYFYGRRELPAFQ